MLSSKTIRVVSLPSKPSISFMKKLAENPSVCTENFFWGLQNFLQLCAINLGEFRKLVRNAE
jgi:hypothetical protein